MNILEKSLSAVDRLLGKYSKDELLSLLNNVRQNQFDGPTMEEYFGVAGITVLARQMGDVPNQPISPPCRRAR
jgi:hypothetical protein